MSAVPVIGLAGNPNTGKSTVFNALTGGNQRVGNWPGKTVARAEGVHRRGEREVLVVDLPGAYSLTPVTPDEAVARDALIVNPPDAVAVVVDATNLERNLYLVAQLLETGIPVVVGLNMMDLAPRRGVEVDTAALSAHLGAPVVALTARDGVGLEGLVDAALAACAAARPAALVIDDIPELEAEVAALAQDIAAGPHPPVSPRWLAAQLLAGDDGLAQLLGDAGPGLLARARAAADRVEVAVDGDHPATLVADRRYGWAHRAVAGAVTRRHVAPGVAERADALLMHRVLGIPIFLAVMWLVFKVVTDLSAPFVGWVDAAMSGPVSSRAAALAGAVGLGGTWVEHLVVDGIVAGVGTVLTFIPVLTALYVMLAVLEDTGYMARAAFVMDRVMRVLGLHGKSFLPLLVGFGCNVPAIYATRVLERRRDRVLTGLLVPFISCSARLPVFVLLAGIFFGARRGTVVFGMYVLSLVLVVAVGWALSRIMNRDRERAPFVMEIPPLRAPTLRTVAFTTRQRVGSFLREAGSMILLVAMGVWLLLAIPVGGGSFGQVPVGHSALASIARTGAPVLAPAGLDSWQVTAALATGVMAKEVVISSIGQAYGTQAAATRERRSLATDARELVTGLGAAARDAVAAIPRMVGVGDTGAPADSRLARAVRADVDRASGGHGALAGLALMVFVLVYVPCVATVAAQRHEFGARWMALSIGLNTTLAWLLAVAVFQGGRLLGLG